MKDNIAAWKGELTPKVLLSFVGTIWTSGRLVKLKFV